MCFIGFCHNQVFGHQPSLTEYSNNTVIDEAITSSAQISTIRPDGAHIGILGFMAAVAPGIQVTNNDGDKKNKSDLFIQPHTGYTVPVEASPDATTNSALPSDNTIEYSTVFNTLSSAHSSSPNPNEEYLKKEGNETLYENLASRENNTDTERSQYFARHTQLGNNQENSASGSTFLKPVNKELTGNTNKPQNNGKHAQLGKDQEEAAHNSTFFKHVNSGTPADTESRQYFPDRRHFENDQTEAAITSITSTPSRNLDNSERK